MRMRACMGLRAPLAMRPEISRIRVPSPQYLSRASGLAAARRPHARARLASQSEISREEFHMQPVSQATAASASTGDLTLARGPASQGDMERQLLDALQEVRGGNFSVRLPSDWPSLLGKVADAFNEIVATNERMAHQLDRVGQVVGREGRTRQRVRLGAASGSWAEMETSVNSLIDDLLWPTAEVTRTIEAVAQGNLLQTMRLDVDGRPLRGE